MYGIHWFRRDLRIAGNPALSANLKLNQGRVVGIFFFDSDFLSRPDFSHNRFQFFLNTLEELKKSMRAHGGDLLVLDSPPLKGFEKLIHKLKKLDRELPELCTFNRDYEPFAQKRDASILELFKEKLDIKVLTCADHLVIEPHEIQKLDGGHYQVFTPFYRAWYKKYATKEIQERIQNQHATKKSSAKSNMFHLTWKGVFGKNNHDEFEDQCENFKKKNAKHVTVEIPKAGHDEAYKKVLEFKKQLSHYAHDRDYPALNHTSHLSIYLKNGSITTAQIFSILEHVPHAKEFLRQLVWREFYYYILFHHPRVEHEAFREKYIKLKWENRRDWFEAWKNGETGYPIVDAGMRQLKTTGFMHNRVRMIVASFLTKDLLIDWRWGEQWFMKNLLDGDIAANNGGWQWAASTGCDPQPYFRIFNPDLQSRKFDPKGDYIRTYVPELRELKGKDIHCPSDIVRPKEYPKPIVNHKEQRRKALRLFKH